MATRSAPARPRRLSDLAALARPVFASVRKHRLTTHATAIAYRLLVALVPLVLLGVALLGALGLEDVWTNTLAPALQSRFERPTFEAIDSSATQIMSRPKATLITFALLLLLWETSRAVRAVSNALNDVHGTSERRPWWKVTLVTLALAVAVSTLVVTSALVVIVAPRAAGGGAAELLLGIGRWPVAVVLLGVAVGLLVRYAPAEHPEPRWASAGSAAIVGAWLVLSVAFGLWTTSVASYRSATGTLAAFLVLTAYVLATAFVFLVGVELDEALRKRRR